jgi:hypothetical protein
LTGCTKHTAITFLQVSTSAMRVESFLTTEGGHNNVYRL